ncbi:unnamed protein product [Leuciscus chuanchicus]
MLARPYLIAILATPPPSSPFTLHSPEPLKSGDSAPLFTPDHSSPSAPPSTLRSVDRHACTGSAKKRERERQCENNTRGGFKKGLGDEATASLQALQKREKDT